MQENNPLIPATQKISHKPKNDTPFSWHNDQYLNVDISFQHTSIFKEELWVLVGDNFLIILLIFYYFDGVFAFYSQESVVHPSVVL